MSRAGKEKVAVYIDGNNFFKYLKSNEINFPKGIKFNFNQFVDYLVAGRQCVSKRYYVGIARNIDNTTKSEQIVKGQQKFLAHLKDEGFHVKPGRVMYDKGKIREKGTDVKIAVDLVVGAFENIYDTAILISSDTDLIPAIDYVNFRKKKIEYVGFSHAPSLAIQKHSHLSILLLKRDIDRFKKPTLQL